MATDLELLVVRLEAQATKFEKEMKKASGVASRETKKIEDSVSKMERKIKTSTANAAKALASFGKGFAFGAVGGGLAAFGGAAASINMATKAMEEFDGIAKRARTVGVGSDFFQTLTFAAGEASIGIDTVNSAMSIFTRTIGEAATGKGELVSKLKELNPELLKNLQLATNQEERFKLIADAVRNSTSATEKAAIATAAFGRGGVELVRVLELGASGFNDAAEKASKLGLVVDKELLTQAENLQNEYGNLTSVIDTQLKQAFINLGPVLVQLAQYAANLATFIAKVADSWRSLPNMTSGGLESRLASLDLQIQEAQSMAGFGGADVSELLKQRSAVVEEIERRKTLNAAIEESIELNRIWGTETYNPPAAKTTSARSGGSKSTSKVGDPVELINIQKVATDELRAAQERYNDSLRDAADVLADGLVDAIIHGESLEDVMRNIVNQFAEMALRSALLGSGQGGDNGLFGLVSSGLSGLFGGFRAAGGPVSPSKAYMVGERGPEMFVPSSAGNIIPNGAGGGPVSVNISLDARGATMDTIPALRAELDGLKRSLPAIVRTSVSDSQRRGALR